MLAAEVLVLESSTHSYTLTKCYAGDVEKLGPFNICTAIGDTKGKAVGGTKHLCVEDVLMLVELLGVKR